MWLWLMSGQQREGSVRVGAVPSAAGYLQLTTKKELTILKNCNGDVETEGSSSSKER